jgi:DNA-binding NarL/FixJ family response regulator
MTAKGKQNAKSRILIVDDHPMTRQGLVTLIEHQPDWAVCFEAQNAEQALEAIAKTRPDLVLADISLPGKSGLELIKDIRALRENLPVLVISMHDESLYAERVLRAGARGYVPKHSGAAKIVEAIRAVLNGRIYVSEEMSAHFLEQLSGRSSPQMRSPVEQLSDREFEVFELIGQGLSAHDIAQRLFLSAKTVDAHRANIKEKLKIKTTAELIAYAARWNADNEK